MPKKDKVDQLLDALKEELNQVVMTLLQVGYKISITKSMKRA